jgi:hypothetical protein
VIIKDIQAKAVLFFVCASVFTACANASLYNDPAAMADFTGRTPFEITQLDSYLRVDVEYAVYVPGTYPGRDFTGGSQYIYAYQVFNSSRSNVAVDFFSVGLTGGAGADLIYTDDTYGYNPQAGVEPSISHVFAQSTGFVFADQNLNPRKWSSVLIFSSVYSPTMGVGTVSGGGLCGMGILVTPSTVPEPATILMIGSGLILLNLRRKCTALKTGRWKITGTK